MATTLSLSVELETAEVSRVWADHIADTTPMMEKIGALGMAGMLTRFSARRRFGEDVVSTGRLTASLLASRANSGTEHTVFRLTASKVEVGSNLHYANQVNFGGTIFPTAGRRAIAIPLTQRLKQSREWPSQIDPSRKVLGLAKTKSGRGIGILIDPTGKLGYGREPLYLLVRSVDQPGLHFAEWTDAERKELPALWHDFLTTLVEGAGDGE